MDNIYKRILKLAQFTVGLYKEYIETEGLLIINHVIDTFNKYLETENGDYWNLYETLSDEDSPFFNVMASITCSGKEQDIWYMEDCLFSCFIHLELKAHKDIIPEDLELITENIPGFITYVENNFKTTSDFSICLDYFNNKVCY